MSGSNQPLAARVRQHMALGALILHPLAVHLALISFLLMLPSPPPPPGGSPTALKYVVPGEGPAKAAPLSPAAPVEQTQRPPPTPAADPSYDLTCLVI